ncbi:MAG: DNA repair protein RadC [Verrucomicrobia bacterium]|nr:DNA repair protein RadC [Verrucomicrobiota bacterium]MBV9657820.1 DNA repair protein RadC [Verrucomicrobiota bacterium]
MDPLRIRELPLSERPRERLAKLGANALSEAELIAILLRTGVKGANALEVARQLLTRHGSLGALARCTVREIASVKGIGPTKAVQLAAAFGLGQRLARESAARLKIDNPEIVRELLGAEMRALHRESLRVLLLDTKYHLLRIEEISLGSLNESIAHPREIFRPALIYAAFALIVVHNHPSGDPTPSQADHQLTRRLAEAARLLQVSLLDHIVLGAPQTDGRPDYFSFKEAGVL